MRKFGQLQDSRDAERAAIFDDEVTQMANENLAAHGGDLEKARNAAAKVLAQQIGTKAAKAIG